MTQQAEKQLKITLVRSTSSTKPKIRATVAAMGLRKLHHSVVLPDNDAVRGMIFAVKHLVEVQEI
ncbi:MAG: 50S ribosomal protein L30 [Eubacteriales bacterium]|nr:50S ribosomal protein L30 [Eubacteriales bacterium]